MQYEIEINNSQDHVVIDESFLRDVAGRTLSEEQIDRAEISIALVDDTAIRKLNRRYLDRDEATDVLSFLLECDRSTQLKSTNADGPRGAGKRIQGEVILSTETALKTAPEFAWTPHDEVVLYLVHGLLHLAGYDDLSESERRLMRSRERAILSSWNLTPRYDETASDAPLSDRSPPADRAPGVDC